MSCAHSELLQLHLDGELDAAAEARLRQHVLACTECAAELALFERVFAELDATPLIEPPPYLTARILDRVLPSQVRRRWLRALGWGYGLAAAASVGVAIALIGTPAPRAAVGAIGVEASQRVAQAAVFIVDSLALAMVHMASGWTLMQDVAQRLSPIMRAITTLLARPGVDLTLTLATVASGFLLLWLRPRTLARDQARRSREIDHAGMLAL